MSLAQCSFQLFWLARLLGFSVQFQIFALNDFTGSLSVYLLLYLIRIVRIIAIAKYLCILIRALLLLQRFVAPGLPPRLKRKVCWAGLTHGVLEYAMPMLVVTLVSSSDIVATEMFRGRLRQRDG